MVARSALPTLAELYLTDETAWLETMAELAANGNVREFDLSNLSEYLDSMARRDRREITSRLRLLLSHWLKWNYQSEKQTRSWALTLRTQRRELRKDFESGTLRNHAEEIFEEVYSEAVYEAILETDLPAETFPARPPITLEELLNSAETMPS